MPKKSKKSQKAKQKKPSLSTHKQTVEKKTVAPVQPKEINEIVALKKASEPPQSQTVETSSGVSQEARQPVSPQKIDLAESTKEVTATKPEEKEIQPVAKKLINDDSNSKVEIKQEEFVQVDSSQEQSEAQQQENDASTTDHTQQEPESTALFQAIGIIRGEVDFPEDGKTTVTIGRQKYPLFYTSRYRLAYSGLKKQIEATGNKTQRLIVYPKVTHFPKRDTPHAVAFQLVGFDTGKEPEGINSELKDNEFKLCGLWQFIPVCRTPCISIFKNFNKERLNYIKEAEPETKVRFMKASHLPLLWRDSPVRPFRFNPKGGKDQGHPAFVSVKARFMPGRDCFGFVEILADPEEKAPRFLKVSKKDKETAMKNKKSKVAK